MNGFIPAAIAVLLAEFGPNAAMLWGKQKHERILWIVAIAVFATGAGGWLLAAQLTDWADALLIGIALMLAAIGQLQRAKPRAQSWQIVVAFWGGGTPLIVFALATRFGPLAASFGGLVGLILAIVLTRVATAANLPVRAIRIGAATLLALTGAWCIVGGLRLG